MVASGSDDTNVRFWVVKTGKKLQTLKASSSVASVVFSPDGQTVASFSW